LPRPAVSPGPPPTYPPVPPTHPSIHHHHRGARLDRLASARLSQLGKPCKWRVWKVPALVCSSPTRCRSSQTRVPLTYLNLASPRLALHPQIPLGIIAPKNGLRNLRNSCPNSPSSSTPTNSVLHLSFDIAARCHKQRTVLSLSFVNSSCAGYEEHRALDRAQILYTRVESCLCLLAHTASPLALCQRRRLGQASSPSTDFFT
jgi:hypothetical protein